MPKSVEDIKRPNPSSKMVKAEDKVIEKLTYKRPAFQPSSTGPGRAGILWFFAALAVVIAIFYVSTLFTVAKVTVTVRRAQVTLDKNFTLPFQTVDVKAENILTVPANGTRTVSQKANGKVIIYNTGNIDQRLVASTRLQAALNSKIYRIDKAVIVPAGKSLEVVIYADSPGPSYNVGLTDFTLPGLKGTSRYEKVYGRSKTTISGGYIGQVKVVAEKDMVAARSELEAKLKDRMSNDVRLQIPEKFVLLDGATSVRFDNVTQEVGVAGQDATTATLKQTGYLTALVFNRNDLTRAIASSGASGYEDGDDVQIPKIEDLKLTLSGGSATDQKNAKAATFNLKGQAEVVWQYSISDLQKALISRRKSDFNTILSHFKAIESAKAKFTPPWARTFPSNPDKIKIDPSV